MNDAKTRDTGVSLTYINNNYIRSDGNTPVSGSVDMKGNTLYNVSDPVNPQDVANRKNAIWNLQRNRKYRYAGLYFNECFRSSRCAGCRF